MSDKCIDISVFTAVRSQLKCAEKEFVIHGSSHRFCAFQILFELIRWTLFCVKNTFKSMLKKNSAVSMLPCKCEGNKVFCILTGHTPRNLPEITKLVMEVKM